MNVPVFNVVIYVSKVGETVQARVMNLPDLQFTASSEPLALKEAVTEAKRRLSKWHASSEAIPWIDPIPDPTDSEQPRLVAVHL